MLKETFTGWFDFLEERFYETMVSLKEGDPMKKIFVVAPSDAIRDRLVILLAQRGVSALNVHFHNFRSLALSILNGSGIKRRSEPYDIFFDLLCEEIVKGRSSGAGGDFVKGIGFSIYPTIKDLRDARVEPEGLLDDEFRSLAAASGETTLSFGELAVIYGKFCERMEKAGVLDQAAEITLAGDAVESGGGRLCDAIVFYGFYDLIGVNQEMTEKLMSRYDSYLFFPFCDDFFLAGARLLLDGFVPEEKIARSPRNPIPGCVEKVISASGTDNEIRAVAKEIIRLHAVEGVSYDDIAIVSRGGDTMNRIFAVLRGEKIPVRGQYHVPGCEMPPLAAFLKLMNLEDSGFPAKHFLDLFASAFFRFQDSAARERTTALLGNYFSNYEITGGVQWKDVAPASDPGIMKRLRIGREDLDMIISGITLIKRIIADIGAIPDAAAPSYYSSAYLDLLRKYFDAGEDLTETGFASQALEQAGERISYLARLDEITPSLRKGDFLGILRRFLSEASFPCGSFRSRGVFAGSAMQARGLKFRVMFIIHMNEGVFPRGVSQDPFLSDAARKFIYDIGYKLDRKLEGRIEEPFLFEFLLRSAERVFLSYQRSDESGKEMLPSPLIGGRGFQGAQSENFPRLRANQIKKTVVESPFLLNAGDLAAAVDPSDLDLLEPLFGVRAVNALGRSRKLGRLMNHKGDCHGFDGIVITGGDARLGSILEDFREKNRLGFSALWDLMTCPFRFFAGTILGAGGLEIEEKPSLDLEHAPAGEMLHGILADLFEKGDMKGCDGFIKKAFDKFRRELAVLPSAIAGLRKGEIEEIVSTVASFYGSAGGDATFITEKPYGISRGEKYKGKMSLSKGRFEIVFPFNFALRIDRITEEKNGGAVEIMDYKYSKGEKRRLGSGNFRNLFQLILYELAYRLREKKEKSGSIILKLLQMKEIPLSGVEEATFDYCAGLGEAAPELAEEFIKRMSLADMAFSNGAFFPVANDACKYCEFSGFCRKDNYYTEMRLVENPLYAKFTGSVEDEDE